MENKNPRVVWQHFGRLFAARTVFDDLVSAPSPVLEPCHEGVRGVHRSILEYGDGVYRAPGLQHIQLVVGEVLIQAFFGDFPRLQSAAITDKLGRKALSFEAYENNLQKIRRVHIKPLLLSDEWVGDRI